VENEVRNETLETLNFPRIPGTVQERRESSAERRRWCSWAIASGPLAVLAQESHYNSLLRSVLCLQKSPFVPDTLSGPFLVVLVLGLTRYSLKRYLNTDSLFFLFVEPL
jgi:hypothetical protein